MLAITLAVKAASAAWDYFNVTVEETQENIDEINSKIGDLKTEIEELNTVQFKTTQQEIKLANLKQELDLQEKLLEIEQKRYYQELTGNSFTDNFDPNNLRTIYEKEKIGTDINVHYSEYGQAKQDYTDVKKLIEEVDAGIEANKDNEKELAKLTAERAKLLEQQANIASKLSEKEIEYYNYYQQAQEAVDSGRLSGTDLKEAEELVELWKSAYEEAKRYNTGAQKSAGTYSYENEIEGILAKADFDGIKDKLVSLGEEGSLSVDTITNRFPELIEYLRQAGIDAQTLLGYIMQMSNPDAINYADAKTKLLQATGVSDMAGITADDAYNRLQNAGMFTNEALEAFLVISVEEDTSDWNIKDWIYNTQKKLNEEPLGLDIETMSVNQTVQELNTKLKPTIDSLADAYNNIFTEDGFTRENIGLDMFSSIQSELDELQKTLSESGISIDYSSFDNFVSVLNDTDSSAQQIKDAFDEVALSIANASITGLEDFEVLRDSLEQLGYIDSEMVAFESLVDNIDALKAAGLDLANATDEQISSFANEIVSIDNVTQAIAILTYAKQLGSLQNMDTTGEIANLKNLAENAGYTGEVIQHLTELELIYQEIAKGTMSPGILNAKLARADELKGLIEGAANKINIAPNENVVDWSVPTKSAGKAGKDAGDAYLDAFEKELSDLNSLRDRGVISEKEYLDRLRALYTRYFADRKDYLDEYQKYERQYLEGKFMPSSTVM